MVNKIEPFDKRLLRFSSNPPVEFIGTILNSIANNFIHEIEFAANNKQTNLLILGMMSVMETVSERVFLKQGIRGCRFYLKNFVDGESKDLKFSLIANDINEQRNVIAHQWISKHGHSFGYDYSIKQGFLVNDGVIIINPLIMFNQFKSAFNSTASITKHTVWEFEDLLTNEKMEKAKVKFIKSFQSR